MKISKYRTKELNEARHLQNKAIELHMPCPPLAWWGAKIIDEEGNVDESIECKCNSYTRNGLNLIAQHSLYITGMRSSSFFGNGIMSYKRTDGLISSITYGGANGSQQVVLSTENTEESIDVFSMGSLLSTTTTQTAYTFDQDTNKLLVTFSVTYLNTSEQTVSVASAGISIRLGAIAFATSEGSFLVVRDVFPTPINVLPGKSLVFNYNFELFYPQ